ncbi:hypothetical protein ABZS66_44885 [Dactylosporangium sp. NPDC005572]|uniref:hypothetical protein n=1 Tax=Dactylosporangium sp. NPDC005572 TaxID=3156889 RepID=UPI0033AA3E62
MGGHVIHTGPHGQLRSTTAEQLRAIVDDVASARKVVLHFHGGLVDEAAGFAIAERLAPVYERASAVPVFFVWRSGLLESVTGNLQEILAEDLFQRMLRWVLRFAVGKLREQGGGRGVAGIAPVSGDEADVQLHGRSLDREPFSEQPVRNGVTGVTDREREQFARAVEADPVLRADLAAVLEGDAASRSAGAGERSTTRMDREVLAELAGGEPQARGLISTTVLARKCAAVLVRVVRRYRDASDHGVYATVVEELLREFYLADVGGAVWAAMKGDTSDTFVAAEPARGGRLFMDLLAAALSKVGANRPELTLVGHSTGAVFIDNLLTDLGRLRAAGTLPADLRVRNVVFLAPACTSGHFAAVLREHRDTFARFRMFTMTDDAERADRLLGAFYPRSLLYLVSGLFERDTSGSSACVPLAGMARYVRLGDDATKDLVQVRDFMLEDGQHRVVWSPSPPDAPAALRAAAVRHGDFDEDPLILESLGRLVVGDDA